MNEYSSTSEILYEFDPITKEFIGMSKASIDPVSTERFGFNTYFGKQFATFKELPRINLKKNETLIYLDSKWEIKKYYYNNNGEKIITDEIPDDAILDHPPKNFIKPKYVNGTWEEHEIVFHNYVVTTKEQVDNITSYLILKSGENKAKTEKLIAGNEPCVSWDNFIKERNRLIKEGHDFILKYNLK